MLPHGLPGGLRGCYATDGRVAVIALDGRLPPRERRATLEHERAHHERGGSGHHPGAPSSWAPVVAREEARVERVVAERLAPDHEVRPLVRRLVDLGEAVTADRVADELDVATWVAETALDRLRVAEGAR